LIVNQAPPRTGAQVRNPCGAQEESGDGPDRHREEADREVEDEALREHRRPLEERIHHGRLAHAALRLRDAAAHREEPEQHDAVRGLEPEGRGAQHALAFGRAGEPLGRGQEDRQRAHVPNPGTRTLRSQAVMSQTSSPTSRK
jgi:hypothetical protein